MTQLNRIRIAVDDLDHWSEMYSRILGASFSSLPAGAECSGIRTAIDWELGLELCQPLDDSSSDSAAALRQIRKHGGGLIGIGITVDDLEAFLAKANALEVGIEGESPSPYPGGGAEYRIAPNSFSIFVGSAGTPARSAQRAPLQPWLARAAAIVRDLKQSVQLYEGLFGIRFDFTGDFTRASTGADAAVAWGSGLELVQPGTGGAMAIGNSVGELLEARGESLLSAVYVNDEPETLVDRALAAGLPELGAAFEFTQPQIDSELGGNFSRFKEWCFATPGYIFSINLMADKIGSTGGKNSSVPGAVLA